MEKEILEIGGRIIYEFRAHPKRAPWESASPDTRAAYRSRMQEVINALSSAGYAIDRRGGAPSGETPPEQTPHDRATRRRPASKPTGRKARARR